MKNIFFIFLFLVFPSFFLAQAEEQKTIHLEVVAKDQVMFDNNFTVNACPDQASSTNLTVNAWCAVDQLNSVQGWNATSVWYSFGILLNGINQYDGSDGNYWLWFSNSEPGGVALNLHELEEGENLLLAYGTSPLKVIADNLTPEINATSNLSAFYFDINSWQWQLAADSTFLINGQEFFSESGVYQLVISSATPYEIVAKKPGFLNSENYILTGIPAPAAPINIVFFSPAVLPVSTTSNSTTSSATSSVDVPAAINFLTSKQSSDGSIGSSVLYSDWSAMAISAFGESNAKDNLKKYLVSATSDAGFGQPLLDAERRSMALMSLGISPYDGTAINYISKIAESFDGNQLGSKEIFNDDIFAIFPLLKAGYVGSDEIIDQTLKFIISNQGNNGSWQNIDLTAAAAQALLLAQETGNLESDLNVMISQSLSKAKLFLRIVQKTDGGFGDNAISTSWALQAIAAMGEPVSLDYLASFQNIDGGFESTSTDEGTRIWTTAYAIPAALGKPWADILQSFSKPIQESFFATSVILQVSTTTAATSTLRKSAVLAATTSNIVVSNVAVQEIDKKPTLLAQIGSFFSNFFSNLINLVSNFAKSIF